MSYSIHGAVSLSSEYGKVARSRKHSRRSTQVISKGRTGPVPVQSGVMQTVCLATPPQAGRTQDVLAPPAEEIALAPKMGNIAIAEADDFGQRAPRKTQLGSILDLSVFDCLNGFPADKDFIPIGVFANAQDLNNKNRDGAGGVLVAGTITVINRSDEAICPGQLVFVDIPDIVTPEGSNAKLPLIKELGAHPQKFCVATRPLHWNSERNATKAIEVELEILIDDSVKNKKWSQLLTLVDNKLKGNLELKDKSCLYYYGMSYACHLIITTFFQCLFIKKIDKDEEWVNELFYKIALFSVEHHDKLGEMADKHNGHTYNGVTGKFKRYPSNRITTFITPYSDMLKSLEDFKTGFDDSAEILIVLLKKFAILIIDWKTEVVNYFRSKVIGRSLDFCTAGGQFTLLMGYYH